MTWVLLAFIHAGLMSHNDDVAITSTRFYNQNACQQAGQELSRLAGATVQNVKFVCIHDPEPK